MNKTIFKTISAIGVIFFAVTLFYGCGKKETTENSICGSFKRSHERNKAKAFVAAQNIPFAISWLFC